MTLLEREGVRVHFPQAQSCCANPPHQRASPAKRARWRAASWGCLISRGRLWCRPVRGGMIKHHWPTLFAGDADEARLMPVAGRVVEFADFLLNAAH